MRRTQRRPLPSGQPTQRAALVFAIMLGVAAMTVLVVWVNGLTAALTLGSLIK